MQGYGRHLPESLRFYLLHKRLLRELRNQSQSGHLLLTAHAPDLDRIEHTVRLYGDKMTGMTLEVCRKILKYYDRVPEW